MQSQLHTIYTVSFHVTTNLVGVFARYTNCEKQCDSFKYVREGQTSGTSRTKNERRVINELLQT